ncbi:MAG TPA: hypothetical protein PLH28_05150, partial [Syntrophales bacterium]|nr:hypothetical protein [Syntrophales bacterium]HPG72325.1 hypothetical protein [Syntrophales bacterium]
RIRSCSSVSLKFIVISLLYTKLLLGDWELAMIANSQTTGHCEEWSDEAIQEKRLKRRLPRLARLGSQ